MGWGRSRRRRRVGAQSGWTYANVALVRARLQELLLALSDGADPKPAIGAFRSSLLALHARPFPPFSFCECDSRASSV
jgi:hypothetical protein